MEEDGYTLPERMLDCLRRRKQLLRALDRLCALAGEFEEPVIRHRLDQEVSQPPNQRIDSV